MNESNMKSTAGPRQFEATAIAKLRARGVPKHVAEAFVKIGLPKSGRTEAVKDQVCKMKYQKYFIERTAQDFADPMRVGAYIPEVVESRPLRFHCEFAMSDIEAAAFSKVFPEFDIVSKGRSYNQHSFYANKRYAECELLVQMVNRDAARSGLDATSLIDLGGNDTWHAKRGREYVHCDNPVLSARDEMRYVVREVFSGMDREDVCNKRFGQCEYKADYAIGVHSTYDIQPKAIAMAMRRRGVKKFFGVINYIQGIENKPAGTYEQDGVIMTLIRPGDGHGYLECGFSHDPSLKYHHRLSTMRKYLSCVQKYDFVASDGSRSHYTYKVHSMRGPTIVFTIDQSDPGVLVNPAPWSARSKATYLVSLKFLGVSRLEVDTEFFDRLVLHAASARNVANYDVVGLFRYAKSLRQRVSMNGVVLSSGFRYDPEQLLYATIAAYGTAMAYRAESAAYFRRATSQIVSLREKGFFKDVFEVSVEFVKTSLLLLPYAALKVARLDVLDRKLRDLVSEGAPVTVELYKPHAEAGMSYDPKLFSSRVVVTRAKTLLKSKLPITPYSRYYSESTLPTAVKCAGVPITVFSKGLVAYDSGEAVGEFKAFNPLSLARMQGEASASLEEQRDHYQRRALIELRLRPDLNQVPVILPNADRMYRYGLKSVQENYDTQAVSARFVSNNKPCVIIRGVGKYAVRLGVPPCYKRLDCQLFILLFDWWEGPEVPPHPAAAKLLDGPGPFGDGPSIDVSGAAEPAAGEYAPDVWQDVATTVVDTESLDVRHYADSEEGATFVREAAASGEYYMAGALPVGPSQPVTPPSEMPEFLYSRVGLTDLGRVRDEASRPADDSATVRETGSGTDGLTVASADVKTGDSAVREYIALCDHAERTAIASAKAVIDIVTSVANGDAPAVMFKSVAQQHPGNVKMVKVTDEGLFLDYFSKQELDHMAVSDGKAVYDIVARPPAAGVYVTSDIMQIYTGSAIRAAAQRVVGVDYECPVTCVDGIAGSGKSYHIVHHAGPEDVVLCETKAALSDLARDLHAVKGWRGHAYTMDAFMLYAPVAAAETLWLDESFRLHEGKQRAIIRMLKPRRVRCFGDSKQIPVLPYLPGIEFAYSTYPYSRVVVKKDTWRCGADVCHVLSHKDYYGYHAVTHLVILRTMREPVRFIQGCLASGFEGQVVLVYSQTVKEDLVASGLRNVMTIGESQGKTFEHVVLFRDSTLNKALYHDRFQALVAVTRHNRTFSYVTVCDPEVDDSAVAALYRRLSGVRDAVLMSHVVKGVRAVRDFAAYRVARLGGAHVAGVSADGRRGRSSSESSAEPEPVQSTTAESEWSLFDDGGDTDGEEVD